MRLSPDAWSRTLVRSRGLVGRGYGVVGDAQVGNREG